MTTLPTAPYNGLTFILDKPSRFDPAAGHLLAGNAGQWVQDSCLPAGVDLRACHLQTADVPELPAGTRGVILCGPTAHRRGTSSIVGYGTYVKSAGLLIPAVPVFYPQDCLDFQSYEYAEAEAEDDEEEGTGKDSAPTKRANHKFWNEWFIKRFAQRILGIVPQASSTTAPKPLVYPSLAAACDALNSAAKTVYLDIEVHTDYNTLDCVGFSVDDNPTVYVVPIYRYNGQLAYTNIVPFYIALARALLRCEIVAHNASFDLTYLAAYYRVPFGPRIYDTMLANHRAFPEAEKSLGHVIAQWTDEPYHKNEIVKIYRQDDEHKLWNYNAKDVHVLRLVKRAQEVYARGVSGLPESIAQANASIRPYIINSLFGLRTHTRELEAAKADAEQRALAWRRVARVLSGIPDFNPGSSTQCVEYFHKTLEYPPVARTEMGKPKLDRKALHKLAINYPNPLIPVIIRYRKANKDASGLHANGWRMPWETKYANS